MKTCVMLLDKEFWEWYSMSGMYGKTDADGDDNNYTVNICRTNQAFQNFAKIVESTIFSAQEGYLNTIMAATTNKEE
jgi:hypothetical protein